MSIKTYGLDAFKQAISYNIDLADKTEDLLRESGNWEIVSLATLAIINFRYNHPISMQSILSLFKNKPWAIVETFIL